MIIHSVTPAYFLTENSAAPRPEVKSFQGGFLEGHYEGQDFIISRVISTDPKYYTDGKYSIGCPFRGV